MAARPLQPSEYEIQREVEALRDLKRRSTNPGAQTIDPDLPNQASAVSPTAHFNPIGDGLPLDRATSTKDNAEDNGQDNASDDPFHLFWVPASMHPEIAPAEFRAFLKEHSRSPLTPDDNVASNRSPSLSSSSSLNRKKSMLSRQYKPKENDSVEEEKVVPLQRNRSLYRNDGPQLTISDLQKLEELAEEASHSDDPSRLRSVLRRSLSLNMSPTAILMDEISDLDDEADIPIVVPPPDKALKRTARTKIRKPGLPGDGGGHRFAATRRGTRGTAAAAEPRTSSDLSASDHGEAEPDGSIFRRPTLSDDGLRRPDSYSEETSIYDAYAGGEEEEEEPFAPTLKSPQPLEPFTIGLDSIGSQPPVVPTPPQPSVPSVPGPILHQPQPQRLAVPHPVAEHETLSRTPSPTEPASRPSAPAQPPPFVQPPIPTGPSQSPSGKKDKDKKGLFKWGDKSSKKANKDRERENRDRSSEKEPGFLFSLFGKKKQDSEYQSSMTGGASGREAAQALLGASKSSKAYVPSTSPGLAPGIGGNPYARYPIHVERAIYRLSHIKLANPRRPLYEQVLISNLMFWYLGVINKAQNPTTPPANGAAGEGGAENQDGDKEDLAALQREREQREKEEKDRLEQERLEKEKRERELEKKKESGRRGSLTKSPPGALPTGGRRAEMPIKGPQYDLQHRVIEQEYGGFGSPPRSPTTAGPPVNGGPHPGYSGPPPNGPPAGRPFQQRPPQHMQGQPMPGPMPGHPPGPPMIGHPMPGQPMPGHPMQPMQPGHPGQPPNQYYYQHPPDGYPQQRPGLPPGAMAPVDHSGWMSQSTPPGPPHHRSPPPNLTQRRSQSPPSHHQFPQQKPPTGKLQKLNTSQESLGERNGGFRNPSRSLSATATTSPALPQPNGLLRKGNSAHATVARPRTAEGREEEDMPLAVWQQQRRK